jgi:chaperonin GroEL
MLLTTETLVVEKPEEKDPAGDGQGHGHSHPH